MPWLRFILGSKHYLLHMRQVHAAYRKESTVEQGKIRRHVKPRLRYRKESYPRSQTWTIYAAVHVLQKDMICRGKPASTKNVVTKAFWTDCTMMTNTACLCQILGGLRKRSFNMTQSHWNGKKEVGTENLGKIECTRYSRSIESAQWLDRSEAKMQNTVWRTYSNHRKWKQPITPEQQVRQRIDQQFEGLEEDDSRLEASTGWRYYPFFQDDAFIFVSTMATKQRLEVNSELDRGKHPGLNSKFFLLICSEMSFRLQEI